ncbi:MAG: beta-propeller domain-containing protein [Pseudomonadota bacterium]
MTRHEWQLMILALACAGLAACGDACTPQIPCDEYPGLCNHNNYKAALRPAEDCEDLLGLLRASAVETMRAQIVQGIESALQPRWCGPSFPIYDTQPSMSEDSAGGAQEYSTTNNQEQGVDEADFVKNDASTVYLLAGDQLKILDVWPPEDTHELSTTTIEGQPHRLFVRGTRAVVYSKLERDGASEGCNWDAWYGCRPERDLKITVLDISDLAAPRVIRELRTHGSYVNARRLDNAVHTVVAFPESSSSSPYGGAYLQTWPNDFNPCFRSSAEIFDAFYALFVENRRQILERPLSHWMPQLTDRVLGDDGVEERGNPFESCQNFYAPALPGGSQVIGVLSLDLDDDEAELHATAITGERGTIYASRNNLYLVTSHYYWNNGPWFDLDGLGSEASMVHRFALDPTPARSRYTASGSVPGRVLNQFALGEYEGFLRMATTTGELFSNATNAVYVLEPQDGQMAVVGSVTGLARSEDIRSARFVGDKGYLVTFKKTDPLFTLDLSDPRHPRVVGELHIPGFSTYIHMMDPTHLLTIGFDAQDEGDFAWFQGLQLQIFDVSNLAQPTLTHKTVIGTRGSSSEASANHLAFNYFAPRDLLSLPMVICNDGSGGSSYGDNMSFAGLLVYDVTVENGFSEHGRVSHPLFTDEYGYSSDGNCGAWWQNPQTNVKRSIVMDDYVLSLSNQRLKINHLDNLYQDIVNMSIPSLPSDDEMMVW